MEQTTTDQHSPTATKQRKPLVAFLLSLLLPGLGQVYNGQVRKAIICFGLLLFIPFILGATHAATFFYGLLVAFTIELIIRIYVIADAVIYAARQKEYIPRKYNTWYYHLLIAIGMLVILSVFDISARLGIKTFSMPTGSNEPTFQVGDWLVADLHAYRNATPAYGDIVIFSKADGEIYTFRVVGLPGDTVEVADDVVKINGKLCSAKLIREVAGDEPAEEFEEELPNGHKHLIRKLKDPDRRQAANTGAAIVPPAAYFLLGDNRDNALDSRYEGTVPMAGIKGRMVYSYWGTTPERSNIDFRRE